VRKFLSFSKTLLFGALLVGLPALAAFAFLRPQLGRSATADSGPTTVSLVVSQPVQAVTYQKMVVKLVVNNAKDLAGFQATLSFDPTTVHLTGAKLSDELSRTGRGLITLGPVIGYDSATLGAATCPVLICENLADARVAQRQTQGVYGRVELAEFEVFILTPGAHTLTLSDVQLVAPDGSVLKAATTNTLSFTANQQ
jgi:hypothetical protein